MFRGNLKFVLLIIVIILIIIHDLPLIEGSEFKIYWNVPTFMCHRYGIKFQEVTKNYNMIQNANDAFKGDKIAILYHSGNFPTYIKFDNNTILVENKIIPQKANLQEHLDKFLQDLNKEVASGFSGLGVLDYERWRPIFRQNWSKMRFYQNFSIDLEYKNFPILTSWQARQIAIKAFEYAARLFFEETIKLVKMHRPLGFWSYYDYPKCYNYSPRSPGPQCDSTIRQENDKLEWLWNQSDVLSPSIYISQTHVANNTITGFVNGRIREAHRIAQKYIPPKPIFPYLRYRYKDNQDVFLEKNDYIEIFHELQHQNIDGLVLWGSDTDVNTREKCINLLNHLNDIIAPAIRTAAKLDCYEITLIKK